MKNDSTVSSRSRFLRLGGIAADLILGAAFLGVVYLHFASGTGAASVPSTSGSAGTSAMLAGCGTATVCITDDHSGAHISFSCSTGAYTFVNCGTPLLTLTGTGTTSLVNGISMLTDRKPDRSISAGLLTQGTGHATVQFVAAPGLIDTFNLNQTIPFRPCGTCGAPIIAAPPSGKHKHHP